MSTHTFDVAQVALTPPVLPLAVVVWTKRQLLTDLKTRKLQMADELF